MWSLSIIALGAVLLQLFLLVGALGAGLRSRLNWSLAAYLTTLLMYSVSILAITANSSPVIVQRYVEFRAAGQMATPLTLLFFSQAYLHSQARKRWLIAGCVIVGLGLVALNAGWVVHDIHPISASAAYQFGPVAFIMLAYAIVYICIAALDLFVRHRETQDPAQSRRLTLMIGGMLIASLGGLVNLLPALRPYPAAYLLHTGNALLIYLLHYYRIRNVMATLRIVIARLLLAAIIGALFALCLLSVTSLAGITLHGGNYVAPFALALAITWLLRLQNDWLQDLVDRALFQEQFKARQHLTALGRSATSSLDLDLLTHLILDQAGEALGVTQSCLMLRDDRSGDFGIVSQRGLDAATARIHLRDDHLVVSWLKSTLQPLTRRHLSILPQFRGMWSRERAELDRLSGELYVPLHVNAELIGILVVGPKASPEPYSARDQDLLTMLANQTAAAVANARLLSEARRHVEELTTLQDMSMKLSFSLDLATVTNQVTTSALKLAGASHARLYLFDQARLISSNTHLAGEGSATEPPPEPDELLHMVADRGQPIVIHDTTIHPLYADAQHAPCAIAGLPLKRIGQTLGVLAVAFAEPHLFSERELRVLALLADQAAMAIENARLYQESLEQKRRIEVILTQTFSGIMVVDSDLRITVFNPGLETITGLRAADTIGRRLVDVFDESLWGENSLLQRAITSRDRIDPEETVLTGLRGSHDVLQGVMPLFDNQDRVIGYLISFADVTHLKEVDRLKSDIVANVSHELRAPLASIKAYTELLLDGMEGNDAELRRQFLSIIDQETNRLSNLITDLLDLARLESGRFEVRKQSVRVSDLCAQAIELFGLHIKQKKLKISTDLPENGGEILADRDMLFMIIKNLVSNAVKFSYDGGHIYIYGEYNHSAFVLAISDEGIGIPPEALPNLFQKFYRVRSTTESGIEGTGLGLALAKQAAEAHGGVIEAQSATGQGTPFTVRLPLE